jgi:predicted HTH transcriptional regulator
VTPVNKEGLLVATLNSAVDQAAGILKDRIEELESELSKLQRALASLTDGRHGKRGPGRPRGASSRSSSRASGVSKRRRRGGTRAEQAVKLIQENPGISASEIAKQMKIKPNYMYRVLADLQKDGHIKKSGRKYSAA